MTGRDRRVALGGVARVGGRELRRIDGPLRARTAPRDSNRLTASDSVSPTSQ